MKAKRSVGRPRKYKDDKKSTSVRLSDRDKDLILKHFETYQDFLNWALGLIFSLEGCKK